MDRNLLREKDYLNPQEAIAYWNLSARRFYRYIHAGNYEFVAYYRGRRLILRDCFERYMQRHLEEWEMIQSATKTRKKR